eukprot:5862525-Alexandrium_andersonii.AAC.1
MVRHTAECAAVSQDVNSMQQSQDVRASGRQGIKQSGRAWRHSPHTPADGGLEVHVLIRLARTARALSLVNTATALHDPFKFHVEGAA